MSEARCDGHFIQGVPRNMEVLTQVNFATGKIFKMLEQITLQPLHYHIVVS